jgi:hypothetical protein
MKKLLGIAALVCALALTASAAEGKKKQLTDDQKKTKKELLDKYDTNKDGKIDKDEKAKMSKEDLAKAEDVGLSHKKKADKSSDSKTETK